jgi:hypothetical protein
MNSVPFDGANHWNSKSYDASGNLLASGNTRYDAEGRLGLRTMVPAR